MASKNSTKTQLELIVDLDLTPGKVEAKKITKGVQKELDKLLLGLAGETKLPLDFKVDTGKIERDIASARKLIESSVEKALKGLGTSSAQGTKSDLTSLIKQKLKASTDAVDKDGKILKDKLLILLQEVGKATGNVGSLGPRGKNPLKEYLDLTGKSVNQAVQILNARAPELKKAIENVINSGNEALAKSGVTKAEQSLAKLTNSVLQRQAVTAQQIKESQDSLSLFQSRTASAANKFSIATGPTSTLADTTRTKTLNEYTTALLNEINAIDLARKSEKSLALTDEELAAKTAELWTELKRVSPELFKLTQNLKDSVKGTPQSIQQITKAAGELADLRIKLSRAQNATANRGKNDSDTVKALAKEKSATLALLDAYTELDKLSKSSNFNLQVSELQRRIDLINAETVSLNKNIQAKRDNEAAEARKRKQEQLTKPSPDKSKVELDSAQQEAASTLLAVQDAKRLRESLADTGVSKKEKLKLLQQELNAEEKYLAALQRRLSAEKQAGLKPEAINVTSQALANQRKVVNSLATEVDRLDTLYVQVARSLQLFFRYAVLYSLLYKAVDSVRALISSVIDLQAALISIKAVAGATSQDMLAVTAAVQEVAETTSFSVTEVAQGGQILVQAGVAIKDFGEALKATANLAASTGASFQESGEIITTFKDVFSSLDFNDIADKLRNAVNLSKLTVTDLKTIGNFLLESAEAFNISADSVLAASATLRNAGIKASTIGTGLRQGLLELFKPDKKTLEGLQKQYASIGQNLSKETISAMFAGFQSSRDPLLEVLNELEKLGVGSVGDNQFTRVLDIRAENTIKTLLRNKDAYIANQNAIKQSGTAAEGAKVQLEALKNSFQNLVETLTNTVYTSLEGTIGLLVKLTKTATGVMDTFKSSLDSLRADTGDTGVFGAVATSVGATIAALVRQVSIGRSLATGLLVGIATEIATVMGASSKAVGLFADAVKLITAGLLAQSAAGFFGKLGGKALQSAAGKKLITPKKLGDDGLAVAESTVEIVAAVSVLAKDKIKSIGAVAKSVGATLLGMATSGEKLLTGLKAAASFVFTKFSPWAVALFAAFEGVSYLIDKLDVFGFSEDVEQEKAKGLEAQAQALKKAQDQLQAKRTAAEAETRNIEEFGRTIDEARLSALQYTKGTTGGAIAKILDDAAQGVVAVGSKALEDVAFAVEQATGALPGSTNKEQLSSALQKRNTAIQTAEGVRKTYIEEVNKALSKLAEDPTDLGAKGTVDAFLSLDETQRKLLQTRVNSLEDASKILQAKKGVGGVLELDKKSIDTLSGEELKKRLQETINQYKSFLAQAGAKDTSAFAALQAQMLKAVEEGQVALVEAILNNTGKLFSPAELEKAKSNKAALELKPFKDALKEVQQDTPIRAKLPTVDTFEAEFQKKRAEVEKSNQEIRAEKDVLTSNLEARQAELERFIKETLLKAEQGLLTQDQLDQSSKELLVKRNEVKDVQARLATLAGEQETTEKSLAAAERQSLVHELSVKAKKAELETLHNTKVHKTEDEVKLLDQLYLLEKAQLASKKELLGVALKEQVKAQGLFDTTGVPLDEVLKQLVTTSGVQALAASKDLADAYAAVTEVTDKEANLRKQYLADLEDAQREELDAKLGEAKKKFTEQQSRTTSLQNNLQNAQSRLATAQDKLASLYEKQAELESFFNQSLREISGQKLEVSDVKSTIQSAAESGSIELAKSAVSDIKSLLSSGRIGKSEATSLTQQARDVALELNSQDIQTQSNLIQNLNGEISNLSQDLMLSRYAEEDLKASVDTLTKSLEDLNATVAASAVADTAQGPQGKEVVQVETSGTQVNSVQGYKDGGLVTGPGGPKEDKVPLWGSHGEFMQPTQAVNLYGKDFMESIRSLKINPDVARAVAKPSNSVVPKASRAVTNTLQPVTFKLGDASLTAMAEADQVPSFQTSLRVQRLKSGRRN